MNSVRSGIYQHYKEGKFYEVFGVERHTETGELLVSYRTLYADEEKEIPFGSRNVRPLSVFTETVQVETKRVPRFTYICPAPWA